MQKKSFVNLLLKCLLSIVAFLFMLEIVLQVSSYIVWNKLRASQNHPQPTEKTVVCVGDSFTFGFGSQSKEGTYPAQLQKLLGKDINVVNLGWPGQNSTETAENMESILLEYKPSVVLIMVGVNDSWSKAKPFHTPKKPEKLESFHWKWRTGRFLSLLFSKFSLSFTSTPKAEQKPKPQDYVSRMTGEEASNLLEKGWKAYNTGDIGTAEQYFKKCAEDHWSAGHSSLVFVLVRTGRQQEALEELVWLQNNYRFDPNEWSGVHLAQALGALHKSKEALTLLKNLVQQYPNNTWIWEQYASNSHQEGDEQTALKAIDEAIRLTPESDSATKSYLLKSKSNMEKAKAATGAKNNSINDESQTDSRANELLAEGWKAFQSGNLEAAEKLFRNSAERNSSGAHSALVALLVRQGRKDEALQEISWLRSNYSQNQNEWAGVHLAQALSASGDTAKAFDLLKTLIQKYPTSYWAWEEYAVNSYQQGDKAQGINAINQAIKLTPDTNSVAKSYFLYWKTNMIREEQPREALKLVIQSFLLDKDESRFSLSVHMGKRVYEKVNFGELMNDLAIPLPTRNQIEQMYADSISENTDRIQAVLESNLRSIVSNCLARGAKPVLISYPRPSYIEESMSKIATEKNISYINVRLKFDQALQTRKQDELFAADGHCNDEGYSIIANAIASMIKNW